jgi:eukaryotic translation initiation factor 2C
MWVQAPSNAGMARINVKLGGVNAYVEDPGLREIQGQPTMFLGADVTHPGMRLSTPISTLKLSLFGQALAFTTVPVLQHSSGRQISILRGTIVFRKFKRHVQRSLSVSRSSIPLSFYDFFDFALQDNLQKMMDYALRDFLKKNHKMPSRLIFFRDGVSEGEFDRVRVEEVQRIRAAIAELWKQAPSGPKGPPPQPKLTFIVVGKRHHIRLFPENAPSANFL